ERFVAHIPKELRRVLIEESCEVPGRERKRARDDSLVHFLPCRETVNSARKGLVTAFLHHRAQFVRKRRAARFVREARIERIGIEKRAVEIKEVHHGSGSRRSGSS